MSKMPTALPESMREGFQNLQNAASGAEQTREGATQQANAAVRRPWFTWMARFGFGAKGVVYVVIGWLAAEAAVRAGGTTTDQRGALLAIYAQPFGKFLLTLVGLGLAAYAVYSFVRAVLDPEREGHDGKGIVKRIGYFAVAITYISFAIGALQFVLFARSIGKSSNTSTQDWTAKLLSFPLGQLLVTLVALIVFGVAIGLASEGISRRFEKHFRFDRMSALAHRAVTLSGQCGLLALAVVFTIISIFLVVAAWQHNPGQAKGLSGALTTLAHQPFGPLLLGIVALGLIAYGVYSFMEALYRRVTA